VTWVPPSGRETVPSFPVIPEPATAAVVPEGRRTGGHVVAHEPVHWIWPFVSVEGGYRENHFASTRTVPTEDTDAVAIFTDEAAPEVGEVEPDVVPPPP